MGALIDLSNRVFGRLTVIGRSKNTWDNHTRWDCLCICGNTKTIIGNSLRRGKSTSCGCLSIDNGKARFKYGRAITMKRAKLSRYGLTVSQYDDLFLKQGGVCALCKKVETAIVKGTLAALSVDHDHKTNQVRGLLCGDCNRGLGLFKDNPAVLIEAAKYLIGSNNG